MRGYRRNSRVTSRDLCGSDRRIASALRPLNGFVVREGEEVGIQAHANERLVDIDKRVERGELDPRRITDLRLN
jgi:hypothetical protein